MVRMVSGGEVIDDKNRGAALWPNSFEDSLIGIAPGARQVGAAANRPGEHGTADQTCQDGGGRRQVLHSIGDELRPAPRRMQEQAQRQRIPGRLARRFIEMPLRDDPARQGRSEAAQRVDEARIE